MAQKPDPVAMAACARRLANSLLHGPDRTRLLQFAEEIEATLRQAAPTTHRSVVRVIPGGLEGGGRVSEAIVSNAALADDTDP
jgi:hypothetical protein